MLLIKCGLRPDKCNHQFINQCVTESLDDFAMHARKKRLAEKYKIEHFNTSCANGHCNSASEKFVKHKNESSAR